MLPLLQSAIKLTFVSAWSPDGRHIAFTSTRSGHFDIWIMDVDIDEIRAKLLAQPPEAYFPALP